MRDSRLDDPEWRVDVGLHRGVEGFCGQLQNVLTLLLAPRVGDNNVEPTQLLHSLRNQFLAVTLLTQISRDWNCFAAFRLDELNHFASIGLLRRVIADGNI